MRRSWAVGQLMLWTLRDFMREPAVLFWTIGFPIVTTLVLGQLASKPRDWHAQVAVLADASESARAEAWTKTAPAKDRVQYRVLAPAELPRALATGKVGLGLEKPWFPVQRRFHYDSANQEAVLSVLRLREALDALPDQSVPLTLPGTRYVDFLLPGMLALGLVSSCLWGIGWNLIEMRQKKLLRLMLASPLHPGTFFFSLFLGRAITAVGEVLILLGFSAWLFDIRVLGSWTALALLWFCGLWAFFGLAVLMGSRTARPAVGQGLINAITLPMFVISGVFFSLDNFPPLLQKVFHLFPPTLMVDATRQVLSAGAGLAEVGPACGALALMGALCFGLGYRSFRFY